MQHIVINFHLIEEYSTTLEKFYSNTKRSGTDYDARYVGGTLEMDSCHLKYNYTDIVISPFSAGAICLSCGNPPYTDKWQSKIRYNIFDTLANDYYCEPFIDSVLQRLDQFFFGGMGTLCPPPNDLWNLQMNPIIPVKCHFVDLSPFVEFDIQRQSALQCADGCIKNGWESGTFGSTIAKKITLGNTYYQNGNCRTLFNNSEFD